MKKYMVLAAVLAFIGPATAVQAGDSATLDVTATVVGNCRFDINSGTLAFGNLNPSSAADAVAQSNDIVFWCTKNADFTITDDNGLNALGVVHRLASTSTPATEYIPYTISYTASGQGLGKTNPITLTIDGTIANADYVNAAADDYQDTVTIEVTP